MGAIQNMVVVLSYVEPDERFGDDLINHRWCRIHQAVCAARVVCPADHEQVGVNLAVEEHEVFLFHRECVLNRFLSLQLRSEVHRRDDLHGRRALVGTSHGEVDNGLTHVRYVIHHALGICVVQQLLNEVNTRFGGTVDLFPEVLGDHRPQVILICDRLRRNHRLLLLQREPRRYGSNRGVGASRESPAERRIPREHLHLDVFV